MPFLKTVDIGLAAHPDLCLVHQIQQPIPKLRILSFHNYKQRRLVIICQTRGQTNRKNSDSYFWLLELVVGFGSGEQDFKKYMKKKSYLFETPKFARHPCHSLKCRLWTRSPSGFISCSPYPTTNNQFQKYKFWFFTNFLTNQIVFDEKSLTFGISYWIWWARFKKN